MSIADAVPSPLTGDLAAVWSRLDAMLADALARLPLLVLAGVTLAVAALLASRVKRVVGRVVERRGRRRNLGLVLGRLAQWAVVFLGVLVGLSIVVPTFGVGELIQLLGIGSVAIGFAFSNILQNFLAGILLLLAEPFRIGDRVTFGGFTGTVRDVQTRATMMETDDGQRVVIPNGKLFTEIVVVEREAS
ncbi:MAG TPA: mechanosensitive ion channel domain-containing protein [Candidatus Binatia bacterium]|jgi:small-conductance mechanosensitive channel|nr:mechanosensitive ion channel domain-containing protein [Candidatus Binatia bacterium]